MIRPIVVVDTNVLVSARYKPYGIEAAAIRFVADKRVTAVVSQSTLAEYEDVLTRLPPDRVHSALQFMRTEVLNACELLDRLGFA